MLATYFPERRLNLGLNKASRAKVIRVSLLPMLIVAALLSGVALTFIFSSIELLGYPDSGAAPEFWGRFYRVTLTVRYLYPLAVALLVVAGLGQWRRAEGAWMLLIGGCLALFALAFALVSGVMSAAFDGREALLDLHTGTWSDMSYTLGFLAIGYFFVAYRASTVVRPQRSPRPPGRRGGRRRRPAPEPS